MLNLKFYVILSATGQDFGIRIGKVKKYTRKSPINSSTTLVNKIVFFHNNQCDQIGRFIALWATFQSLWLQFICPNLPHSDAIFVKLPKYLIFLVKSFLGNFCRHLANFYWSHWQQPLNCEQSKCWEGKERTVWELDFRVVVVPKNLSRIFQMNVCPNLTEQ